MDSKLKKRKNGITLGDVESWLVAEIARVGRRGQFRWPAGIFGARKALFWRWQRARGGGNGLGVAAGGWSRWSGLRDSPRSPLALGFVADSTLGRQTESGEGALGVSGFLTHAPSALLLRVWDGRDGGHGAPLFPRASSSSSLSFFFVFFFHILVYIYFNIIRKRIRKRIRFGPLQPSPLKRISSSKFNERCATAHTSAYIRYTLHNPEFLVIRPHTRAFIRVH